MIASFRTPVNAGGWPRGHLPSGSVTAHRWSRGHQSETGPDLTGLDLLQEALVCRYWGWSVFPLGANKRPVGPWKRWQERRPSDRTIHRMFFGRSDLKGLAVVLGAISGRSGWVLACRDFDTLSGYWAWAGRNPGVAALCPTVRTARGYHVYCRLLGRELFEKLADGDLRADRGHYAVLPPSRHPAGVRYEWVGGWPLGLRAFPLLSLGATGFLPPHPSSSPSPRDCTRPPSPQPKQQKTPKTSCVRLGSSLPAPVQEAVRRTLPTGPGQRNGQIFDLARSLADIAPGVLADYWRSAVQIWWEMARPVIRTQEWSVSWRDFVDAWERVRLPISHSRPRRAIRTAVEERADTDPMLRLKAICECLQAEVGMTFYLSCRTAADALGVSRDTAARWLREAVRQGWLEVVVQGKPSARQRKATVYRLGREWSDGKQEPAPAA